MEILLRFILFIIKILGSLLFPIYFIKGIFTTGKIPPITSHLLTIPVVDLADKIRKKELTSELVVQTYINRIKEVNPILNAVVEERFEEAMEDARKADKICSTTPYIYLLQNYPLLGVPFTVKESCSLKSFSKCVGSVPRANIKADKDGEAVGYLKSAGAIPLLISATPELCLNWETNTHVNGCTRNSYDLKRTSGGSSGGEGALIGAGASLFGIGSDVAGSIRVPSLFNGIFGHKPTAKVVSLIGHLPESTPEIDNFLVIGPMARYAKDLPILVHILAGPNADKLRLTEPVNTKDIKIHYMLDAGHSWGVTPVSNDIKISMLKAVQHFKHNGLTVDEANLPNMQESLEISLVNFYKMSFVPSCLDGVNNGKRVDTLGSEVLKCIFRQSKYTFAALLFELLHVTNGFVRRSKSPEYEEKGIELKNQILKMLGKDGVLFYPTFPVPAFRHNQCLLKISGVMYTMFFNILGFPSTHVTLGLNSDGLPIGFQVVAAPYEDRLCLAIAQEIEAAFGGWVPPS